MGGFKELSMKFDSKDNQREAGEEDNPMTEYDKDGNIQKGGGFYKECGKLVPMKKAEDLTADDLQKSLDKLEEFAKMGDTRSRKDELLARAAAGNLAKSENEELFQLLGGGEAQPVKKDDGITKSLTDNEPLQKSMDVSSYLQENHEAMVKSLDAVGDAIQKSDARRHEFALIQAKAILDIGNLVKSMSETLDAVVEQPVSGPKSAGVRPGTKPLQKSFAGTAPGGEEVLTKSMILDSLDGLMVKSMTEGQGGRTMAGEDINLAIAKFETTSQISPSMMEQVKSWRANNRNVA